MLVHVGLSLPRMYRRGHSLLPDRLRPRDVIFEAVGGTYGGVQRFSG